MPGFTESTCDLRIWKKSYITCEWLASWEMVCCIIECAWWHLPQESLCSVPYKPAILSTQISCHASVQSESALLVPSQNVLGIRHPGMQWGWCVAWYVISDIPYNSSVLISFFSFLFQLLWAASRKNYQPTKISNFPMWSHEMLALHVPFHASTS
jgi:hypothetical protein